MKNCAHLAAVQLLPHVLREQARHLHAALLQLQHPVQAEAALGLGSLFIFWGGGVCVKSEKLEEIEDVIAFSGPPAPPPSFSSSTRPRARLPAPRLGSLSNARWRLHPRNQLLVGGAHGDLIRAGN